MMRHHTIASTLCIAASLLLTGTAAVSAAE